jgi:hypothetical protein
MIRRYCPWGNIDEVEHATLQCVDMFNHRQLVEPIGIILPAEFEQAYRREESAILPGLTR